MSNDDWTCQHYHNFLHRIAADLAEPGVTSPTIRNNSEAAALLALIQGELELQGWELPEEGSADWHDAMLYRALSDLYAPSDEDARRLHDFQLGASFHACLDVDTKALTFSEDGTPLRFTVVLKDSTQGLKE